MEFTAKMHLDFGIQLTLEGDLENAVTAFCSAIQARPDYAPAYNNLGLVLRQTERFQEAKACFCRAIELESEDAFAYNNLGLVLMDLEEWEASEQCFRVALQLKPKESRISNNLGTVLEEQRKLEEAEAAYRQAIALQPEHAEARYNLGKLLRLQKQLGEAEQQLREAVRLRPGYWEAELSLANLYLLQGKPLGWSLFERLRKRKYKESDFQSPVWQGEALAGCSILLYWEYGFGDTIQFVRYVKKVEAEGARIYLWVQPLLKRLVQSMFPHVPIYGDSSPPQLATDYVCSLMTLPLRFPFIYDQPPALVPCGQAVAAAAQGWRQLWQEKYPEKKYRIGFVWASHPKHISNVQRSMSLADLAPLFSLEGILWVNLQVDERREELRPGRYPVADVTGELKDFLDTAAVIESLDLVITVDTAVAHLAGTLGKKTWILLPCDPDWRWYLDREDSPWYPMARLFRQQVPDDWSAVVQRVQQALLEEEDRL